MTAFMSDENIEDLIFWNIGNGIAPEETIKDLQKNGIQIPDYIIEEFITHRNRHLL